MRSDEFCVLLFLHLFFFKLCVYLFIYLWLCWVFVSVWGLSLVVASGGHSSSQRVGLSLSRPLIAEHRLQTCRLSNCGSRAQSLSSMWDPPKPGLEPVSPALAGRLSTTVPPGKPLFLHLDSSLSFIDLCYCFLHLYFIYFFSVLMISLLLLTLGFFGVFSLVALGVRLSCLFEIFSCSLLHDSTRWLAVPLHSY